MLIVGISAFYHDAACCAIKDGRIVAAAEEERFSRVKHDPRLPRLAFAWCLEQAEATISDVDCIAFYEQPKLKLARQLWASLPTLAAPTTETLFRYDGDRARREIRRSLGYDGEIRFYDHHESHAASAYYPSGFDEAALLTIDGVGEWDTMSYGWASGATLTLLKRVPYPHSIGLLYSAITSYLGFDVNDGEYKVMGLAPYGRATLADKLRSLIRLLPDGQLELDTTYLQFADPTQPMFTAALVELLGIPPRTGDAIAQHHSDLAASIQLVTEDLVLAAAEHLHDLTGVRSLCLAGGVALNCVANRRLRAESSFSQIYVQPAAGDAGCAVGAACLAHVERAGERPCPPRHTYLGPAATNHDVLLVLEGSALQPHDYRNRLDDLLHATAERLAAGGLVGWLHGPMEFGPRALGGRSILADPRGGDVRDRVNHTTKMREAFRPFAPAVLWDHAKDHFDLEHHSPYMLETCNVKSSIALPAITHVDGSARPQTVHADTSPRFYALLQAFFEVSGCPVLLNTSFNLRGEPIVRTVADALTCFIRADIDHLVLEDFLIDRADIPESWLDRVHPNIVEKQFVSPSAYAML